MRFVRRRKMSGASHLRHANRKRQGNIGPGRIASSPPLTPSAAHRTER